jgi:5-methylthioadenosine/S-adenosylhomocysteine deaminase
MSEEKKQTLYSARWVLPITSLPVENGAVVVEGEKIIAVGDTKKMREKFPVATEQGFGEAAIMPGLVNCHSHLELTVMRGYLEKEEADFFAWLRKLTVAKNEVLVSRDLLVSAMFGAIEAVRVGITCLGDASDYGTIGMNALRDVGLRGIVYQETFGPDPKLADENIQKLKDKIFELKELKTELVCAGVSPHAPYTVSTRQLELIADYAQHENLPVMMHAAESKFEKELMLEGKGAFAEGLAKRGIEWNAPRVSTIQYLAQHEILKTKPLLAHCINVDEKDLETIKSHDARVAHCPKSNAKLRHGIAPFTSFVEKDLKVGLGSDSVASNNSCDIFEEARFALLLSRATNQTEIKAEEVLATATIGGARALGLENKIGSLEENKDADLVVISLNGTHQQPVHDAISTIIFASSGRDVLLTVVAGREIYKDGKIISVDEDELKARMNEMKNKLKE